MSVLIVVTYPDEPRAAEVRVDAHVPVPRAVPAGPPARRRLQ